MSWLARLKKIAAPPGGVPTETTKTLSVVFVGTPAGLSANSAVQVGVADAGPPLSNESLRSQPPELLLISGSGHVAAPPRRSGNPLMTPEQGDECHAGSWDDAEINAFEARQARFTRMGRADAEHLAERLTLRDREGDDRRLCLECTALAGNRHCMAAARGRLAGADRRLEPVPTILQRCPGFSLAPGMT